MFAWNHGHDLIELSQEISHNYNESSTVFCKNELISVAIKLIKLLTRFSCNNIYIELKENYITFALQSIFYIKIHVYLKTIKVKCHVPVHHNYSTIVKDNITQQQRI